MDSMTAFAMGQANSGKLMMVFDWDKAAQLIRERQPQEARAGLSGDWEWTGGRIYENGAPVPKDETYTYLASTWATPELELDDETVECYIMEDEAERRWGKAVDLSGLYWTNSALNILNGASS